MNNTDLGDNDWGPEDLAELRESQSHTRTILDIDSDIDETITRLEQLRAEREALTGRPQDFEVRLKP